jgi:hypothetical protein
MDLKEIEYKAVGVTHMAQDKDQWQALVNMLMNLQVL